MILVEVRSQRATVSGFWRASNGLGLSATFGPASRRSEGPPLHQRYGKKVRTVCDEVGPLKSDSNRQVTSESSDKRNGEAASKNASPAAASGVSTNWVFDPMTVYAGLRRSTHRPATLAAWTTTMLSFDGSVVLDAFGR